MRFAVLALALVGAEPAMASLTGATVSANYEWPDLGTTQYPSGSALVGPGIEFSDIEGTGIGFSPFVDFSATNIQVVYPNGWHLDGNGSFDGFDFRILSGPSFTGATLVGTNVAGLTQAALSFDDKNVYLNTLGLGGWGPNSFVSIDVASEPTAPVGATLTGATVSANYEWPDLGTAQYPSGSAPVGPGVEFSDIEGTGVGVSPFVDFSATNIQVVFPNGWHLDGNGSFDGFDFRILSGPSFTGATLAGTNIAGLTQAALSFDGKNVYLNTLGLGGWGPNSFVSIDVALSGEVPEPATWAMMIVGFGLIGAARRRQVALTIQMTAA